MESPRFHETRDGLTASTVTIDIDNLSGDVAGHGWRGQEHETPGAILSRTQTPERDGVQRRVQRGIGAFRHETVSRSRRGQAR